MHVSDGDSEAHNTAHRENQESKIQRELSETLVLPSGSPNMNGIRKYV